MAELKQFRLPDVGEGLTEADIVTWRVKPGDQVTVNQVIVEIETAKSLVELPSPYDGVVTGLLVPEGQTVDVGTPIIEVNVGADAAEVRSPAEADAGQASTAPEDLVPPPPDEAGSEPGIEGALKPKPERQAVLVGYGVKLGTTTRRPRKGRPAGGQPAGGQPPAGSPGTGTGRSTAPPAGENGHTAAVTVDSPAVDSPAVDRPAVDRPAVDRPAVDRPAAKPPVRKLAKDLGVDLAALAGTGPNGTITREDVQAAAGRPAPGQTPASRAMPAGGEERIPVRGVRKHTAAAMTASAFTAPHVTEFLQIDMTETMRALPRLRDLADFEGLRVSPLLFVAKALLVAVARHPMINSSWDEDAREIVLKHYVNLGIAAATDRGLLVPTIKDAHALSLPELARALGELATTARQGKTQPAELAGGTITITNVGIFGIDTGTPILTPGQAAILAFGQVKDAPWVHEGALAVRSVTTLALSFDHRIVDGDLGSAVLRDVGAMLTDPVRMLAWG